MIAACPRCGARYRIERNRIKPEGVRLRCARCEAAFRVRPPAARSASATPSAPESARPAPAPAPRPAAPGRPAPTPARPAPALERPAPAPEDPAAGPVAPVSTGPAPSPEPAPPGDRSRRVVVADADLERAKRTAAELRAAGLEVIVAHDGVEAILTIQRVLPRAVILNDALPRMFGFQICELVKRNESLRSIGVVLVGSDHPPERTRRPPGERYGADAYLEDLPLGDATLEVLRGMGLPVQPSPPRRATPVSTETPVAPRPTAAEAPAAPAPPTAPTSLAPAPGTPKRPILATDGVASEEFAKAERLARIIVSDIVLYSEDKFSAAVANGNVLEAMDAEVEEGRALFRERVSSAVRSQRDFLRDELLRVARSRGMK